MWCPNDSKRLMSLFHDLQVNFDIQKRMLYHETKDITDVSVIGKWSIYATTYICMYHMLILITVSRVMATVLYNIFWVKWSGV